MNISEPFIKRPVGTSLITLAVALVGVVAYFLLAVAPLPQIDFPTIRVSANLPGASPETMASTVATPLERNLGRIAGISEMTSSSSMGQTSIIIQFDLSRDIDGAAREVQAAINAAMADLPTLPSHPTYRKLNPADMPIMILGLTSETMPIGEMYDLASTVLSQKVSQIMGVGQVQVSGSSLPAIRIALEPGILNNAGLALEEIRASIARANVNVPKGTVDDGETQWFVEGNSKLYTPEDFGRVIVKHTTTGALRLNDVGEVFAGAQDVHNAGYANGKLSVLLIIYKEPGSNVIETVERVRESFPLLRQWTPPNVDFTVVIDRSPSIKSSLHEVEVTLVLAILLVVLVVFLFLRNGRATIIPAISVPVSLLGTFGVMYLLGYSLNHLSLMALTIATGFVVDDAIVVTENIVRHMENGEKPLEAALKGSREVAFTVVSMTLSLVAIFIPILSMGGMLGRLFKEFAFTLSTAVLVSLAVSLVTTPMMCAILLRGEQDIPLKSKKVQQNKLPQNIFILPFTLVIQLCKRIFNMWINVLDAMHEGYAKTLSIVLRHKGLTLLALVLTVAGNFYLYKIVPKGFFPDQDTGQIFGMIQADQSISFQALNPKLVELMNIVRAHEDVENIGGFTGGGQRNSGVVFITLKPKGVRDKSTNQIIGELRQALLGVPGAALRLQPMQDIRVGGRRTRATYQYTMLSDDLPLLREWSTILAERFASIPGLLDVNSDQEARGLQTTLSVDKDTLNRLGVTQKQFNTALGLAFGQSFASTIYEGTNQYRVVMEFAPRFLQGSEGLGHVYVPGSVLAGDNSREGIFVPLHAVAEAAPGLTALAVSRQEQMLATTISFNLAAGYTLQDVESSIKEAVFELGMPESIKGGFQGTAKAFKSSLDNQPLLILAALVTLYIVLGILYESLIHPLTILSTLPSAGVGAILALLLFKTEFTIIAFIGVLLLCGIVKKNAILMIDFALDAQRNHGLSSEAAIYKACILRFRPIMMTTMSAVFGAIPLLLSLGEGSELRSPLGITIIGGLLVSQLLTLYTTPVVYLYLDKFAKQPTHLVLQERFKKQEKANDTSF